MSSAFTVSAFVEQWTPGSYVHWERRVLRVYITYKQQNITSMGTHTLNLKCGSNQNVHTACYACTTNGQNIGELWPTRKHK
jgi:hypothetical protein